MVSQSVGAPIRRNVLIVEDDEVFRRQLAKSLGSQGFEVAEAPDLSTALAIISRDAFDCAVVDLRLPGGSGLEVVRELGEETPDTRTVVLTGFGSIASALEALRLGAVDYLTKPATVTQICAALLPDEGREAAPSLSPGDVPSLARVEWEHINRVLTQVGGNVSKAAQVLGIHRRSLQRKLSKFPSRR